MKTIIFGHFFLLDRYVGNDIRKIEYGKEKTLF